MLKCKFWRSLIFLTTYDNNGNLTKDLNKGIFNISYNSLSLPQVVTFSNGNTITYLYTADGRKLRTVHVTNGTATTTDYCGNVIYENGTQKLLLTEEGYINLNSPTTYYYYLKDHQGNNRVVVNSSGAVQEVNHYYPFGGTFASSNVQPYKYNGKELDTKNGLNWYDYGARHYDAVLGCWFATDPLAEKYYAESPYTYCGSNPVNRIDLFGMDYWSTSNPDEINRFWSWMSQNGGNGIDSYSFMTDSWNRMTDKKFLEAYEQALTYNDQTNKLYSSYVTYENGEFVVNGVSVNRAILLGNQEYTFTFNNLIPAFGTSSEVISELFYSKRYGTWLGKDGKLHDMTIKGNQYMGGKNKYAKKWSKRFKYLSKNIAGYSIYNTWDDYSKGQNSFEGAVIDTTVDYCHYHFPLMYGLIFGLKWGKYMVLVQEVASNLNAI